MGIGMTSASLKIYAGDIVCTPNTFHIEMSVTVAQSAKHICLRALSSRAGY
jgi:hypothetical protein